MRSFPLVFTTILLLPLQANAQSGQRPATPQPNQGPAFEQAVCACRGGNRSSSDWAACMRTRGFDAVPGSGMSVSCSGKRVPPGAR